MDIVDHRLTGAVSRQASPHFDARPRSTPISLIVVHGISLPAGHFGGPHIRQLFSGDFEALAHAHRDFVDLAGVRVSSHLLIARDGRITQFVPFDKRAWHAGESCYDGQTDCNDFSIGIELEGTDNDPYRQEQYRQLSGLVDLLAIEYPVEAVVGHSDIAPSRKSDPGPAFNWRRLKALLSQST
ncbi:MAG: 1,6-anhydro-N-acetylmuramyl-L-alanine amidase AmpD, partial [Pseudomonadota bacterium]